MKHIIVTAVTGLMSLSLFASEGQIKREFTVTQIALDQQHSLVEQKSIFKESNTTAKTNTKGGAVEN